MIAIGEVGLDYFYFEKDLSTEGGVQWQHDRFILHMSIAKLKNLPFETLAEATTENFNRLFQL